MGVWVCGQGFYLFYTTSGRDVKDESGAESLILGMRKVSIT